MTKDTPAHGAPMRAAGALLAVFLLVTGPVAFGGEQLTLTFSTTAVGGKYAPKHVLAVWVEDDAGKLVKSLGVLGRKRAKHLTEWKKANGGKVDGVTGATRRTHQPISVTWDLCGRDGAEVAPGAYRIMLEMADDNANKNKFHRTAIPFWKDGEARRQELGSQDGFKDIVLEYGAPPAPAPADSKAG